MGRAPRVERLLLYDWTSQAPQSALLSLDRVSEVKGGRLGWWFLQRSREKDERDWEGMQWGGSVEVAARKRPNCASQAISHFKEGGMPGEDLVRWNQRTKPWPEVGVIQHSPFPCWFGFRHFGYSGAATTASRPSPLYFLCASFRKLT